MDYRAKSEVTPHFDILKVKFINKFICLTTSKKNGSGVNKIEVYFSAVLGMIC